MNKKAKDFLGGFGVMVAAVGGLATFGTGVVLVSTAGNYLVEHYGELAASAIGFGVALALLFTGVALAIKFDN